MQVEESVQMYFVLYAFKETDMPISCQWPNLKRVPNLPSFVIIMKLIFLSINLCYRTDLTSESSGKNCPKSHGGDSNQLLSNNELEGSGSRQERANSATSFASTLSLNGDFCKICHCGGEPNSPLITPCFCSGSLKHVHQVCNISIHPSIHPSVRPSIHPSVHPSTVLPSVCLCI